MQLRDYTVSFHVYSEPTARPHMLVCMRAGVRGATPHLVGLPVVVVVGGRVVLDLCQSEEVMGRLETVTEFSLLVRSALHKTESLTSFQPFGLSSGPLQANICSACRDGTPLFGYTVSLHSVPCAVVQPCTDECSALPIYRTVIPYITIHSQQILTISGELILSKYTISC